MNLTDKIFQDADAARAHLEATRWPEGPICPHCGVVDQATDVGGGKARKGCYQCNACRSQFTVTVGTVFERSKVPLNKWLLATYLLASSKKGYSAHQLHRTIGVTYKTAWFMFHRIREAMVESNPGPLGGEGKFVEVDETYVGGKQTNMHKNKRLPKDLEMDRKQAVVTLVERNGAARSFHMANVTSKNLRTAIVTNADRASNLMTDGFAAYQGIGREFASHAAVNHQRGEYVRGTAHSNTAENFFSILKRGVIGTYHHVSEAHLSRYLAEFDFRYSNRSGLGVNDTIRTDKLLVAIAGKRLTYRRTSQAAYA